MECFKLGQNSGGHRKETNDRFGTRQGEFSSLSVSNSRAWPPNALSGAHLWTLYYVFLFRLAVNFKFKKEITPALKQILKSNKRTLGK